jgi:uncharacterized protein involved in exopolysaccharide biosynthesis
VDTLNQTAAPDEVTVEQLLAVLNRWRWVILAVTLVATAAAAAAALLLPKWYEADIVISPASTQNSTSQLGGLSSLLSEVGGGLASLAGVGTEADTKRAESLAVLQSEALTENYIRLNDLLPILYASDWNPVTRRWKPSLGRKIPTLWKANRYFNSTVRTVKTDAKTGIVTLMISWKDPLLAAQWANGLVKMTNDYLRHKALDESARNITYLNEEAAKTDLVGARQAIFTLLESEIDKEMLARGNEEYAFKVLDPAESPERASYPRPTLWTVGAFIGTLGLSVLAAFARVAWSRN